MSTSRRGGFDYDQAVDRAQFQIDKATAILRGANATKTTIEYGDGYAGEPFLAAIKAARRGDPEANAYVKVRQDARPSADEVRARLEQLSH